MPRRDDESAQATTRSCPRHLGATAVMVAMVLAVGCHSEGSAVPKPLGAPPAGMVAVTGGTFQTGGQMSQNAFISVDSLFIDETEVTVAAYTACVQAERCNAENVNMAPKGGGPLITTPECNYGVPGREQHPVNCVDWNQANAYCRAQGKRLDE